MDIKLSFVDKSNKFNNRNDTEKQALYIDLLWVSVLHKRNSHCTPKYQINLDEQVSKEIFLLLTIKIGRMR